MAKKVINTIINLKDQFTPKIKKTTDGIKRTKKEIKKLERQVKLAQNQINKFGGNLNKAFVSGIKNVGKFGTAFTGVTTALAVKSGFSEAFDMEGYKVQLETAVKDTVLAGKKMAMAVKFANSTPFETGQIVEATAMMESMGLNADKWLSPLADMAGATNKSMAQATEAMIDASVGEFERLKEFGLKKDMIMLAAQNKFGKNTVFNARGQVTDQIKLQEVLAEMMAQKYKGGAEKLSKTAKGLWSTVTGVTKSALAKIVGVQEDGTIRQGSLYEQLKDKIKIVADTLTKWQEDGTMQKIGDTVTNVVSKSLDTLGNSIKFVKDNMDWLAPVSAGVLTTFLGYNAIAPVVKFYKSWKLITEGAAASQSLLNFAMSANPAAAIAIGFGILIGLGLLIWKNWDKIKVKAFELWEGIKKAFTPIGEFFNNIWTGIKNGFRSVVNFVVDGLNIMIKGLLAPFNFLVKGLNKLPAVNIPELKLEIPKIPSYATGTSYFRGGLARTDEGGRGEIKEYPNGTKIIPADKSKKIVQNMTNNTQPINVNIYGNVYGEADLIDKVGNAITKQVKKLIPIV